MFQSIMQTMMALVAIAALAPAGEPAANPADQSAAPATKSTVPPAQPAQDAQSTTDAGRDPSRKSRVLFITTESCERCEQELARLRRAGGDFEKMKSRGWKIGGGAENHLQIVELSALPDLAEQLGEREYPVVACIEEGQIIRSFQSGCTTPLDMWTFAWLAKGVDERPKSSVPEAARVESTGSYPLRGNHWSVDGDWSPSREKLITHLRGPYHASKISASWIIENWSYEELRSLHDNLHEAEGVSSGSYASRPQSNPFSASRKTTGH